MFTQENLTQAIVVPTQVPSPPRQNTIKYAPTDGVSPGPAKIELRGCSEFVEYASSVRYFNSGSKLQTLQGFDGEPMIFAIGQNNV
jgi:hypothetical protein